MHTSQHFSLRHLCCDHLCKILSQDCPHGKIRHTRNSYSSSFLRRTQKLIIKVKFKYIGRFHQTFVVFLKNLFLLFLWYVSDKSKMEIRLIFLFPIQPGHSNLIMRSIFTREASVETSALVRGCTKLEPFPENELIKGGS